MKGGGGMGRNKNEWERMGGWEDGRMGWVGATKGWGGMALSDATTPAGVCCWVKSKFATK